MQYLHWPSRGPHFGIHLNYIETGQMLLISVNIFYHYGIKASSNIRTTVCFILQKQNMLLLLQLSSEMQQRFVSCCSHLSGPPKLQLH